MKKFLGYIAGVVTGMLIASIPIFADSYTKSIEALVNFTTIKINGTAVESDNFVVDGKTYVWIRDAANMLGKKIIWDENDNTADIVDEGTYIVTEDDKQVIATVDDATISKGDVTSASLLNSNGATNEEIIQNALEFEIDINVALNEAAKNGYVITDEVKNSAKSLLEQYRSYYKEQFTQILSSYNMTEDAYRNFIEKNMVLENFSSHLSSANKFTDEELQAKYNELIDQFETATAKHILIKTEGRTDDEAKAEIDKIAKELKSVKEFDKLMAKYSEDTGSKDNTEGMTFGKGEMVPEFEKAAFTQEIGAIGKPVKSNYGYHIILVTKREPKSFDGVKTFCEQALFKDWYKTQVKEWRKSSNIAINEDVLNSLKNK